MADEGWEEDRESLRRMVIGFCLSELQDLMSFVGEKTAGKLEDVQRAALELLLTNNLPVEMKIRELHSVGDLFQDIVRPVGSDMPPIGQLPPVGIPARPTGSYRNTVVSSTASAAASTFHLTFSPLAATAAYDPHAYPLPVYENFPPSTNYENIPPSSYGSSPQLSSYAPHPSTYENIRRPSRNTAPRANYDNFPWSSNAATPSSYGSSPLPSNAASSTTYHNVLRTLNAAPLSSRENFPQLLFRKSPVKFKQSPFYQVQAELLRPVVTIPGMNLESHKVRYLFELTPQQAIEIVNSRTSKRKQRFQMQIHLRCCVEDISCEQFDLFPNNMSVKVNTKPCLLPKPVLVSGIGFRRPSLPVDITLLVSATSFSANSTPSMRNQLLINWDTNEMPKYAVAVYLVKKLTAEQLLDRLKAKEIVPQDYTKNLIQDTFKESADSINLGVSILCPLGKQRMEFPCRGGDCTHVQCFDALSYLWRNALNPTWTCPVCKRSALYEDLYRDGLFTSIVETAEANDEEVIFLEDGSWEMGPSAREGSEVSVDISSNDR